MSSYIRDYLLAEAPIKISQEMMSQFVKMVLQFEIRDEHPLTLNSQLFGVNKFAFTTRDRQLFFDIIGCDEDVFVKVIKKIPSINNEFKVVSDAFNVCSVYLIYLILNSNFNMSAKDTYCTAILNYMQYRFIGSAVNHYFPHNANHDIMQTVIESLNLKFSIRQLGSWRAVVTERSKSIIFEARAHHNTLKKFDNDKDILYLISDTSTRIRSQLKIITSEYYSIRETNNFIMSHSSTTSLDGEKVLRERDSSFETLSVNVFNKILIKSSFIDERYIRMVQNTVSRLNVNIIRRMLGVLADEARYQLGTGDSRKIITKKNDTEIYVGVEALVDHIIHVIYTAAIHNPAVNINSKIAIYQNTKNIFTASRTSNPELVNVRLSIEDLFKRTRLTSRDSTISGLSIVLALYLTLISFSSI